jgi:cell pole-organizing protein PopZ
MNTLRTEDDYKRAIKDLLGQAETSLETDLANRDGDQQAAMSNRDIQHFMRGLDLAITEEATIALRAEFLRYSSVFDTKRSQEAIKLAVAQVIRPMMEEWINRYMADIAREVITEAIGKITKVRATGNLRRPK